MAAGSGAASGNATAAAVCARATIASRSTWACTSSAARARARSRSSCSAAVTRPRCLDGRGSSATRGSAPSTGGPPSEAKRVAYRALMSRRGDAVEDDTSDDQIGVNHRTTAHTRRQGPRGLGRVDDEHDGGAQPLGQFRGGMSACGVDAIVDAAIPFHDDQRTSRRLAQRRTETPGCHQERVEIASRAAGRRPEPRGIDVVGALLVCRHRDAASAERAEHAEREQRLAAVARQAPNHDPRGVEHHGVSVRARPGRGSRTGTLPRTSGSRRRRRVHLVVVAAIGGVTFMKQLFWQYIQHFRRRSTGRTRSSVSPRRARPRT